METNQVMVMPYPGRGHINPLLNLCHVLSYKSLTTVFTVVLTEEWSELIGSDPKPANVRFAIIPNVVPSEINRGTDPIGFFIAAQNNMEIPFDLLLDNMEQPVNLIIADATLKWTLNVGIRRNIPVAAYWPMSASMFTMWYHVDLLQEHQHIYVDLSERGEEYIDYIPGLSPIKAADFPVVDRGLHDILPDLVSLGNKSQSLLLATDYDLEPKAIDAIKHKLKIPVYTFSPNFPLEPTSNLHNHGYFSWPVPAQGKGEQGLGPGQHWAMGHQVLIGSYRYYTLEEKSIKCLQPHGKRRSRAEREKEAAKKIKSLLNLITEERQPTFMPNLTSHANGEMEESI